MKKISLISSGKLFNAYEAPKKHYIEYNDLLNDEEKFFDKVNIDGFVVLKNALNTKTLSKLRNKYYNLFPDNYKFKNDSWHQINNPAGSHGYGNHPVKKYLKSEEFLNFAYGNQLKKIASIFLGSNETVISKRILVRSFSKCSTFTTQAHKDSDYYVSSDQSKAITAWVPLGPADKDHGQLIYLENSHNFSLKDYSSLNKSERVITSDLEKLASQKSSKWLIPKIEFGDILLHCLKIVHASFESIKTVPRLSCDIRFAASPEFLDPRWNSFWFGEDGL